MNWHILLDNKNIDSQVLLLNDIMLNICRNFLPYRYVNCDNKDPVWLNENITSEIKVKNKLFQVYVKKDRPATDFWSL